MGEVIKLPVREAPTPVKEATGPTTQKLIGLLETLLPVLKQADNLVEGVLFLKVGGTYMPFTKAEHVHETLNIQYILPGDEGYEDE